VPKKSRGAQHIVSLNCDWIFKGKLDHPSGESSHGETAPASVNCRIALCLCHGKNGILQPGNMAGLTYGTSKFPLS
jgi:hypothetical protein